MYCLGAGFKFFLTWEFGFLLDVRYAHIFEVRDTSVEAIVARVGIFIVL